MKYVGAYYWYVKIPQCRYMENGLKDIAFYAQKHITPNRVCHNFPLVHNRPPRDALICETSLLSWQLANIKQSATQVWHQQLNRHIVA